MKVYQYSIEMLRDGNWEQDLRYYYTRKKLTDFDLKDIPNKRRNAKLIHIWNFSKTKPLTIKAN